MYINIGDAHDTQYIRMYVVVLSDVCIVLCEAAVSV
jgi:hypothetical protein